MAQETYLVIGGEGFLGSRLAWALKAADRNVIRTLLDPGAVTAPDLHLDFSGSVESWKIPKGVDTAFFFSAVTSLDECRKNPEETRKINVENTILLARRLAEQGIFVIFPSSNLVFDGTEPFKEPDDPVKPCTEYGRQKAETEQALLELGDMCAIVRFTKIIDEETPLISRWCNDLVNGREIRPFSDMVLSPVPLELAVAVMLELAAVKMSGIWQVSGVQDISYEELAFHLAKRLRADPGLVRPVKAADSGMQFECIPRHTTLDCSRLGEVTDCYPPDPFDTIDFVCGFTDDQR